MFRSAPPQRTDSVVAILKAREPARILVAIGDRGNDSPHLEYKQRWVNQLNFCVNGSNVRAHMSLFPIFRTGVPEPAPLAGDPDEEECIDFQNAPTRS
jgi:hypothetical protein